MSNGNQPPPPPAAKKGLGPLAWVAIGCGALILVGLLAAVAGCFIFARKAQEVVAEFEDNPARAAAELVVRMNPDLELVESDPEAGTITIRDRKSGEVATFDYSEIEEGRFRFETDEGEVSLDVSSDQERGSLTIKTGEGVAELGASASLEDVPDWVLVYPDATRTLAGTRASTPEAIGGSIQVETSDEPGEVLDFYAGKLEADGWEIRLRTLNFETDEQQGTLIAEKPDLNRTLNVTVGKSAGVTQAMVIYSEQKQ